MLNDAQQGALWPMLHEAWTVHAIDAGVRVTDSKAKDQWRKQYLGAALGVWSLKQVPRGGPLYARVMGKLQEIARNGIDWILKAGDAQPPELLHHARQFLAVHDIPEPYACGIARQSLRLEHQPDLEDLAPEQLAQVIRILHAQAPRIKASAAKKTTHPPTETPF